MTSPNNSATPVQTPQEYMKKHGFYHPSLAERDYLESQSAYAEADHPKKGASAKKGVFAKLVKAFTP